MKCALLISGIVELLGAIVLFLRPDLIFGADFVGLSKVYGLAAFSLGLINIFAFQHFEDTPFFKKLFLLMMGFHAALALICYGMSTNLITFKLPATITHLACFVVFFITYMRNVKPDN